MPRNVAITFSLNAALKSGFTAAFQSASSAARGVSSAVREMEKSATGRLGATMGAQREKIRGLSVSLREARSTLATLQGQATVAGGATGMLARQIAQAEQKVNNLSGAMKRQLDTWRETVAQGRTAAGTIRNLATEYNKLSGSIARGKSLSQAINANQTHSDALRAQRADLTSRIAGTVAVGATVGAPVKMAMDFESSMADVKKVTDFTDEAFAKFSNDILTMSTRLPMSAKGLSEIAAAAGAAGIAGEELLTFSEDAAKMGVAFDVSAADAGAAMTGLRNNFKLSQDGVRLLGDAMNQLANTMDAKAAQIVNFANRAGGTAKIYGFTGQQVSALGASFLDAKVGAEEASTATNAMLVKLGTADKLSDDAQEAFASLGLSGKGMAAAFKKDAQWALSGFLDVVSKSKDPMRALNAIFGAEHAPKIARLVNNLDRYKMALDNVSEASKYQGSMEDEYTARANTTANSIELLKNSMTRLGVTIGNAMLPVVSAVAEKIAGCVGFVTDLAGRFPMLTRVVGIAAGAFGALVVGGFVLSLALNAIKTPLVGMRGLFLRMAASQMTATATTGAFGAATTVAGAGARFFAGGLRSILMATGVGAVLVGIGYGLNLLMENWDAVVAAIGSGWNYITDTWGRLGVFFTELGNNLIAIFPGIWESICSWAASAANTVTSIWQGATGLFSGLWSGISNGAAAMWQGVQNMAGSAFGGVCSIWTGSLNFFSGIRNGISNIFSGLFDWLKKNFAWVFSTIDAIGSAIGKIKGAVTDAWNKAFGDDDKKPAKNAENAAKNPIAPIAAEPLPNVSANSPSVPVAQLPAQSPVTATSGANPAPQAGKPSLTEFMKDYKGGASSGKKGKGSRKKKASDGPVTIVRLAGDNSRPQTIFIPAGQKAPASIATSAAKNTSPRVLPRTPALIAKTGTGKARSTASGAINIDLTQNFDLIAQDAGAVRKVLESIKPDMETLVRRALEKISSDKRRTAYAQ